MSDGEIREVWNAREKGFEYNHKVVDVIPLDVVEDAYDLGVENESHTFLVSAGVFVHNSLPGALGSTSLTRMDSRYARTVKRVQKVLKSGIRDMIDFYCLVTRRPEALYEVKMAKITTAEEADISEELRGKAEIADSILRMIDSLEGVELDKVKIFKYITSKVLDVSELGDMVIKDTGVERSVEKEIQDAGEEGDGFVEPEDSEPINSEDPETIAGREARRLDTVVKMKIDECLAKKGTLDKEDIDELLRLRV